MPNDMKSGSLNLLEPLGHTGPVTGLLYLYIRRLYVMFSLSVLVNEGRKSCIFVMYQYKTACTGSFVPFV